MTKLKSARHHWWPEAVSQRWADHEGCVHRLRPDGNVERIRHYELGAIGNAHHIKYGKEAGEQTPWDQSFEHVFESADSNFPKVIDWLDSLPRNERPDLHIADRFLAQPDSADMLSLLAEGLVSLAVRSPKNREDAVRPAEYYRGGPLSKTERRTLIGANIQHSHRKMTQSVGTSGKFVVVYSPEREFIFGDGFFHTVRAEALMMRYPRMFVPLTPTIAVLYARPPSFLTNPKLMTVVATPVDADALNRGVQVYAKDMIFYRQDAPQVIQAFRDAQHLEFASRENPIDCLIELIPGIG